MLAMTIIIPFVFLAIVFFVIFSLLSKTENEGENVMKSIYIYLVLFATLMMSIGGSIGVFMAVADVVSPAPYHQSFEEYRQFGSDYNMEEKDMKKKTEEELRASYDAMIENDKQLSKDQSINALIKSLAWIIIPLPLFIYFQRRIPKKE